MIYFLDIETNTFVLDEVTTIHVMCVKDQNGVTERLRGTEAVRKWVAARGPDDTFVGHNIVGFDYQVHKRLCGAQWKWSQIHDTLISAQLLWPSELLRLKDIERSRKDASFPPELTGLHSLKAYGFRLGIHKGDFNGPWDTYSEQMADYCAQDVDVLEALYRRIMERGVPTRALELETRFALLMREQESFGFAFDLPAAAALCGELSGRREALRSELVGLVPPKIIEGKKPSYFVDANRKHYKTKKEALNAGLSPRDVRSLQAGPPVTKSIPFNPASRTQVAAFLLSQGWQPTELTDSGNASVAESVLESLAHPAGKKLAAFFRLSKILGMLSEGDNAWMRLYRNGRIHGSVRTMGAVTGRCAHVRPNIAQVPSVAKGPNGLLWGEAGGWNTECRVLFRADPGWKLVGADASGLELRCLAHYLARWDGGEYAKVVTQGDVHTTNQEAFGLPAGPAYRGPAKNGIYCVVYGGGDWKFGITLFPPHLFGKKSDREYKRLGAKARAEFRRKISAYGSLVDAVSNTVTKQGRIPGIDGRKLPVRKSYAALNTLLQSAGALIVKWATVRMVERLEDQGFKHGPDFKLVAHVHDEVQVTCRPELADAVGRAFVGALADAEKYFEFQCPLTGTYNIGSNWAETH
jgi:DNA polymerase-1